MIFGLWGSGWRDTGSQRGSARGCCRDGGGTVTGGCPGAQQCLGCSWRGMLQLSPVWGFALVVPGLYGCAVQPRVPAQLGEGAAGWGGSGELRLVCSTFCAPGLVIPLAHPTLQSHFMQNHHRSQVCRNQQEGLKAPCTETMVVSGSVLHWDTSLTPNPGGEKKFNKTWEMNWDVWVPQITEHC